MKTSEFKKVVNNSDFCIQSGFDISDDHTPNVISVKQNPLNQAFLTIDLNHIGDIIVRPDLYPSSNSLDIRKVKKVVQAGVQLAFTPIEEREDEPRFLVAIAPGKYLMRQMGEYIILGITERNWASGFTPNTYTQTLLNQPQWGPFLPPYDANNTDVFVPVEEDNEI
jgi:hypothetical protein